MIYGTGMEDRPNMAEKKVLSNLSLVDTERRRKKNSLLGKGEQIMFQREREIFFRFH